MEETSNVLESTWHTREIFKISGSRVVCMLFWIALSTAMIVIGTLYINKCPVEPKIPIYLIVAGTVYLAGIVLLPLKIVSVKLTFCLEIFVSIFSFCWFTAGSIWVFSIYQDDQKDCDDVVYKFSFGVLILKYIFLAFISTIVCLCSCCISFLSTRTAMDPTPEKEHLVSIEH